MEEKKKATNIDKAEVEVEEEEICFCPKCGAKNKKGATTCVSCGRLLKDNEATEDDDIVRCPKCGSTQIELVTYQASQNLSAGKACCGYIACGPLGALFGIGPKTKANTKRKCKKCGHEF